MRIIDISWPIMPDMTTYKNKSDVQILQTHSWETSAKRESQLNCGMHTGTHVDAPAHFLESGVTIDQLDLNNLIGPAQVLELGAVKNKQITAQDLSNCEILAGQIILLKTSNSNLAANILFEPDFVYLASSGAEYLASKKIKAVGIDYLGIERNQPEHATHKILFRAGVVIIEGLRLAQVTAGNYQLICLPLNMIGQEAALARAILINK